MSFNQRLFPSGSSSQGQQQPPKSPGFGPFRRPTTPLFGSTFGSSSSSGDPQNSRSGRNSEGKRAEESSGIGRGGWRNVNNSSSSAAAAAASSSSSSGGLQQPGDASISKAPTSVPLKPPKPAALRMKKPKSLSISLLTGGGSNNHNNNNNNGSTTHDNVISNTKNDHSKTTERSDDSTDTTFSFMTPTASGNGSTTGSRSNGATTNNGSSNDVKTEERSGIKRFGYDLARRTSPLQHRRKTSQASQLSQQSRGGGEARPSLDLGGNRSTQLFDSAENVEVLATRARSQSALGFFNDVSSGDDEGRGSSSSSSSNSSGYMARIGGRGAGAAGGGLDARSPSPFLRGHFAGAADGGATKKLKASDGMPHARQESKTPLPTDPVYVIGKEPVTLKSNATLAQRERPDLPPRLPGAGQDDFLASVARYRQDPTSSDKEAHVSSSSSSGSGSTNNARQQLRQGQSPQSSLPQAVHAAPYHPSSSAASPFLNTISATAASPSLSGRAPAKRRPLPPPLHAAPFLSQPQWEGLRSATSAPEPESSLGKPTSWEYRQPHSATSAHPSQPPALPSRLQMQQQQQELPPQVASPPPPSQQQQQQQQQQEQQRQQSQQQSKNEVRSRSASHGFLRRPPSMLGLRQNTSAAQSSPLVSPIKGLNGVQPPPQRQPGRDMLDMSSQGRNVDLDSTNRIRTSSSSSSNHHGGAANAGPGAYSAGAGVGGSSSGNANGSGPGALQSLGQQLGGMGVAVGKRGWGFMKNWSADRSSAIPSPTVTTQASSRRWHANRPNSMAECNDATKLWLSFPDAPVLQSRPVGAQRPKEYPQQQQKQQQHSDGVFGMPLREAVLRSRCGRMSSTFKKDGIAAASRGSTYLDAEQISSELSDLDLGSEFKVDLPTLSPLGSPGNSNLSPLGRSLSAIQRTAVSREMARSKYLPAVVVRCIQAVERWGMDEEGIYRLSGRSSHTAKLRMIFDGPTRAPGTSSNTIPDLELADVGPADLDLNSVCSLLKSYLRELPENLLPSHLADEFNRASKDVSGMILIGDPSASTDHSRDRALRASMSNDGVPLHVKVAEAIRPLMDRLPAANWYLLRELAMHFSDLVQPDVVKKTRMPLTNLCLVLAPTLSLSVIMLRALVECQATLFGSGCPVPDDALDAPLPFEKQPTKRASRLGARPSLRRPSTSPQLGSGARLLPDADEEAGDSSKRLSVATITNFDKRKSTSSVLTLRRAQPNSSPALGNSSPYTNGIRPTTEFGMLGFGSNLNSPDMSLRSSSALSWHTDGEDGGGEPEEDEESAPPIASRFIRSRQNSIIGLSPSSSTSSSSGLKTFTGRAGGMMSKPPSQASLASSYLRQHDSAFHGASSPRVRDFDSSDRDSINSRGTLDDIWSTPLGLGMGDTGASVRSNGSHASPSLAASTSGDSIRGKADSSSSVYGGGGGVAGALDRPRPPTSGSGRFLSSNGDVIKTSGSGASSGGHRRFRSNNVSQSSLVVEELARQWPSSTSSSSSPLTSKLTNQSTPADESNSVSSDSSGNGNGNGTDTSSSTDTGTGTGTGTSKGSSVGTKEGVDDAPMLIHEVRSMWENASRR